MSQREILSKPFQMLSLGGINERLVATELPPADFSRVEGTFPHYAGMQTRMFGKRLLAKYADPILGIAQFWTPLGYAQGLYQFDDKVDAGPWQTPVSNIVIPPLPPSLGFDGGYMTLDDFGNSYGSPVSPPNVCNVGFVGFNSAHVYCGPEPDNVSTPDDSNGGPGGQGQTCRWELVAVDVAIPVNPDNYTYGGNGDTIVTSAGPLPYPIYPNRTPTKPASYSPAHGPYGNIFYAQSARFSYKVNLGFGNWDEGQGVLAQNTKATIDFSPLVADLTDPPALVEFRVRHNGNIPFDYAYVPIAGLTFGENGNFANFPVDVYDYIIPDYLQGPNPLGGGFTYSDFVVLEGIRLHYNRRVCS